ncbi:Nucleoside triphosphate pyrophosphatase Maf-like protein [Dillenia turbinata]|uniref:Nucleoside triphosphate pyrophosphatase Maf-like protein n=1 Tax=Dillenia turbinata TaxID=194707 RepID=A0AAN8ZMA9_9MAGN
MEEMGYEFTIMTADIDEKAIRKEQPEVLVMALAEAKADAIISKLHNLDKEGEGVEATLLIAADTAEAIIPRIQLGDTKEGAKAALLITCDQVDPISSISVAFLSMANDAMLLVSLDMGGLVVMVAVVVYEGMIREKPSNKEEARKFIKDYSCRHAATVSSVLVTNLKTGLRKGHWDKVEIYFREIPDEIVDKVIEEGTVLHVAGGLISEHPLVLPCVKEVVGATDSLMGLPKALTERLIKEAL